MQPDETMAKTSEPSGLNNKPSGLNNKPAKKVLFGFHAVAVRLKTAPASIEAIYFDPQRRDGRMREFLERAKAQQVHLIEADAKRLVAVSGTLSHQGVVALASECKPIRSLDDWLDGIAEPALLLVLDGMTDPHNLGACLRVADGVGVHAVIAPKDHAAGINATVSKVASGAAETVPYFMVTNLARTLNELKERSIWCIGTSDPGDATIATMNDHASKERQAASAPKCKSIYDCDLRGPTALVIGAEGAGMRVLTRRTCDELVYIPMRGVVESLNASVAAAVCLYEALRQRHHPVHPVARSCDA